MIRVNLFEFGRHDAVIAVGVVPKQERQIRLHRFGQRVFERDGFIHRVPVGEVGFPGGVELGDVAIFSLKLRDHRGFGGLGSAHLPYRAARLTLEGHAPGLFARRAR